MVKSRELADPNSCLNRAKDEEQLFVLLGRDRAAPFAIRSWCQLRIALGLNGRADPQIVEALATAAVIEHEHDQHHN